jgi:hypothetical protein
LDALFGVGVEEAGESGMRYVYRKMKSRLSMLKLVGSEAGQAANLSEHDNPGRVRLKVGPDDDEAPVLLETERQLSKSSPV